MNKLPDDSNGEVDERALKQRTENVILSAKYDLRQVAKIYGKTDHEIEAELFRQEHQILHSKRRNKYLQNLLHSILNYKLKHLTDAIKNGDIKNLATRLQSLGNTRQAQIVADVKYRRNHQPQHHSHYNTHENIRHGHKEMDQHVSNLKNVELGRELVNQHSKTAPEIIKTTVELAAIRAQQMLENTGVKSHQITENSIRAQQTIEASQKTQLSDTIKTTTPELIVARAEVTRPRNAPMQNLDPAIVAKLQGSLVSHAVKLNSETTPSIKENNSIKTSSQNQSIINANAAKIQALVQESDKLSTTEKTTARNQIVPDGNAAKATVKAILAVKDTPQEAASKPAPVMSENKIADAPKAVDPSSKDFLKQQSYQANRASAFTPPIEAKTSANNKSFNNPPPIPATDHSTSNAPYAEHSGEASPRSSMTQPYTFATTAKADALRNTIETSSEPTAYQEPSPRIDNKVSVAKNGAQNGTDHSVPSTETPNEPPIPESETKPSFAQAAVDPDVLKGLSNVSKVSDTDFNISNVGSFIKISSQGRAT